MHGRLQVTASSGWRRLDSALGPPAPRASRRLGLSGMVGPADDRWCPRTVCLETIRWIALIFGALPLNLANKHATLGGILNVVSAEPHASSRLLPMAVSPPASGIRSGPRHALYARPCLTEAHSRHADAACTAWIRLNRSVQATLPPLPISFLKNPKSCHIILGTMGFFVSYNFPVYAQFLYTASHLASSLSDTQLYCEAF